ncbi:zinc finger matrin-type protein CG9776 isoform X3 [Aethina tumida]|uniref:zinc finger matrin-type protein CG9776 isoform X3 n=1 Tax=Aethina tumida TaxID=116153 RepID=UPI002147FB91|nr:zinc finger matrin-type protein CG9776 isoform X3 [Aethina tumida]
MLFICYFLQNQTQPTPPGDVVYPNTWGNSTNVNYGQEEKKEAVAQEMQQQRAQLMTQREEYVKKASVLRRELELLRDQKQDLLSDGSRDRDLDLILKENDKLQDEIHSKLKAIVNVIEMLSSIIKDGKTMQDLEAQLQESPKNNRNSPASNQNEYGHDRVNYVHYDTGLHWCRVCDEFPDTAKKLLVHLQSTSHLENVKKNDAIDTTPWHKLPAEPLLPTHEGAPQKRVPIKGLQFFIAAPSWYCKLCDVWIGDLHCASHHLKSQAHFQNYESFIGQNPQWEVEWLTDRKKALARIGPKDSSDEEESKKKKSRKEKKSSEKRKKKRSKKRRKDSSDSSSSSSSSDSSSEDNARDNSRSIRVAMRNKAQSILEEDLSSKWSVLERLVEEHKKHEEMAIAKEKEKQPEDKLISQWMTVQEAPQKEKDMLGSLKDRMKEKQDRERAKQAEADRKRGEREKIELEQMERKKREARERMEEEEKERKRREQEEYERILDKQRNQVKFKTFRKRRSDSEDDGGQEEEVPTRIRKDSHSDREHHERHRRDSEDSKHDDRKKPPPPPSYKKLPFIGRMPLFKNKKMEEKVEKQKEIKKEEYEKPRRTRFEPGNLPKAFIPKPDVVCFPKLSSIPPLTIPPPPSVKEEEPKPPSPPKISEPQPSAPPPPKIGEQQQNEVNTANNYNSEHANSMMDMYYSEYNQMYAQQQYDYGAATDEGHGVPLSHTLPLEPPPLPPEDDLAMLGICADDMAAQSF